MADTDTLEAPDDEAVADEWEAALNEEAADEAEASEGAGTTNRVLNQDEIDSLLGFDGDDDGNSDKSGIYAIINSALISYDRLPMLDIIFDRLVRMMSTSLRNFTSDNIEVSLDNITSIRFGDYLNSIPLPAILTVFRAEEWDNFGLITVDSSLIYSIVDVLLGGRRGTAAMRIEGRPYTTIEQNLVERMNEVVLNDLKLAFDPLVQGRFQARPHGDQPAFRDHRPAGQCRHPGQARIDMEDRGGRIELFCLMRRSSRSASCCSSGSWARSSAGTRSGKATLRPSCGRPPCRSRPCSTSRSWSSATSWRSRSAIR